LALTLRLPCAHTWSCFSQVATGRLDRKLGVAKSLVKIGKEGGIPALYAGVQPRMLLSSLFTAVGFSSFEAMKRLLHVDEVAELQ
jgi:Mitochondrial carrier protein